METTYIPNQPRLSASFGISPDRAKELFCYLELETKKIMLNQNGYYEIAGFVNTMAKHCDTREELLFCTVVHLDFVCRNKYGVPLTEKADSVNPTHN